MSDLIRVQLPGYIPLNDYERALAFLAFLHDQYTRQKVGGSGRHHLAVPDSHLERLARLMTTDERGVNI